MHMLTRDWEGGRTVGFLFPAEGKEAEQVSSLHKTGKPWNNSVVTPRLKKSVQCSLTCWAISWDLTQKRTEAGGKHGGLCGLQRNLKDKEKGTTGKDISL